ncbi:carbon-nitrogen hydrolase family protein [Conexibacter sp. SYSU D00693]|uniref:carbon-nitrogen hydrolase family protein n=1 Tax=Conexibacter sp. SYSU D00693 TaxID=2812560 RepID=UPI00196B0D1A|nr:carbon-nitrogen hydrolase family protein [Conexibacter sp. SYSU D00693]
MAQPAPKFIAAAVQATPVYLDLEATVDKTIALVAEAARNGAKLVVFPETWIPGYPYWAWLGPPAWAMKWVPAYVANSMELDSEAEARIAAAAAQHDINVVLGFSERSGGSLYIAQLILDAEGRRVAARRKLKPTHVERTVFGEGDGSHLAVHDVAGVGRLGALACWEHFQPLTKFAMYSQDEQVHAASWPSFASPPEVNQLGPDLNDAANQVYAAEGGCFVVAATTPVTPEIVDLLCESPEQRRLVLPGGGRSMVFGPDGSRLAAYLAPDEEGLVLAEVDLGLIPLAKALADPAGHYARPDVTRLLFNREPAPPVSAPAPAAADGDGRVHPSPDAHDGVLSTGGLGQPDNAV